MTSSPTIINGRGGQITQDGTTAVSSIRKWQIQSTVGSPKGTMSNGGNMQVVLGGGNTDWTLSYDFYGKSMPILPGTAYASFYGYNGNSRATGAIICESLSLKCEIENSQTLISGTGTAGANGALALTTAAAPTPSTTINAFSGVGCFAKWTPIIGGTAGSEFTISGLRSWSLDMKCQLAPYVSSTNGNITKRTAGNYSASATIDIYESTLLDLDTDATRFTPGTPGILKLYVDATHAFILTYAVTGGNTFGAEIEAGSNNSIQIPFDYSGAAVISGTVTRGSLTYPPSDTTWV